MHKKKGSFDHMEKRFCPDCGTEIIGEGGFCPKCGRPVGVPAPQQPMPQMNAMPMQQMPMQQMPMQQVPMQQMPMQQMPMQQMPAQQMPQQVPQQVPMQGQPAAQMGMPMMYVPYRNTKKIWGIIGGCFAAAAIITGIILLVIFGGNPAGEVLTDYRDKDIIGNYNGTAVVESISVGGDYEMLVEHKGYDSEKLLKKSVDRETDCSLSLSDRDLTIQISDPLFLGNKTFVIDDAIFDNGRAKDDFDTNKIFSDDMEDSEVRIQYDLTLHEGLSRESEYRIYGTVEIEYDIVLLGIEASYSIELTVDCDK